MSMSSERQRADAMRDMFGAIAHRYDFLNHFLSGNIDRRWRERCVRDVASLTATPSPRVLDIGCGTGDLSIAFSTVGKVVGCDFCHPMLTIGREKVARFQLRDRIDLLAGDALSLPFVPGAFDAVVSAFVVRNLANIEKGLVEMRRVLRPGGILGILDFGMPQLPLLGTLYRFYFQQVLPKLGKWISGVDGPYSYLPASVRTFPSPDKLSRLIAQADFSDVRHRPLTQGIAILLTATAGG